MSTEHGSEAVVGMTYLAAVVSAPETRQNLHHNAADEPTHQRVVASTLPSPSSSKARNEIPMDTMGSTPVSRDIVSPSNYTGRIATALASIPG